MKKGKHLAGTYTIIMKDAFDGCMFFLYVLSCITAEGYVQIYKYAWIKNQGTYSADRRSKEQG